MNCNCKTEIEQKLLEDFKARFPNATDHKVTLQGYVFGVVGNTLKMAPYMPVEGGALHLLMSGGTKWKKDRQNMMFSFCPFCGEKIE